MRFVNNWFQIVTLAAGVTTLALDLEDGEYLLTLADDDVAATRWEVVRAVVESGTATLERGQEGTTDQDWPDGSLIYIAVTAGWLNSVEARLAGGGVTVSESLPGEADVPAAVGATWVVPGQLVLVAMGAEHGSDWAVTRGQYPGAGFSYQVALPGLSYTAPYEGRRFAIELTGPYAGVYPAGLVLPWVGAPYDLEFTINPSGAEGIALSLDCTAMGDSAFAQIENHGVAGAALAVDGSTITITVNEMCRLTMVSQWREQPEFGFEFRLEPVTAPTYLFAPE